MSREKSCPRCGCKILAWGGDGSSECTNCQLKMNPPLCEVKDSMKDLGEAMIKALSEGRSFTAEQVENMTLKELGLKVKGRVPLEPFNVGVYIEVPNSPDVCLNLKHTTLKGATVIVTESFAV